MNDDIAVILQRLSVAEYRIAQLEAARPIEASRAPQPTQQNDPIAEAIKRNASKLAGSLTCSQVAKHCGLDTGQKTLNAISAYLRSTNMESRRSNGARLFVFSESSMFSKISGLNDAAELEPDSVKWLVLALKESGGKLVGTMTIDQIKAELKQPRMHPITEARLMRALPRVSTELSGQAERTFKFE